MRRRRRGRCGRRGSAEKGGSRGSARASILPGPIRLNRRLRLGTHLWLSFFFFPCLLRNWKGPSGLTGDVGREPDQLDVDGFDGRSHTGAGESTAIVSERTPDPKTGTIGSEKGRALTAHRRQKGRSWPPGPLSTHSDGGTQSGGKWRGQNRWQQPNLVPSGSAPSRLDLSSLIIGGKGAVHTSLKIANVSGALNMIACSGEASIPLSGRRGALHQHENGLIDIDDQSTDCNEVKKPSALGFRSILNAEEERTDGHLAKSDAVQYHDLTEPSPFHRRHKLSQRELIHVVGESRASGQGLEHLSHHGGELPSPSISRGDLERSRARTRGVFSYQGDGRPEIVPAEAFGDDCVAVRSKAHQNQGDESQRPCDTHEEWSMPAIWVVS